MAVFSWLFILSFLFIWFWKNKPPKGFPPGPWRLPLLWNLLQINKRNPLNFLDECAEKYGPVYSLYLGTTPVVLIHGFPLVKEVLVIKGTKFAGKPDYYIVDTITKKKGIISQSYGEVLKEQKRFSLRLFRNFGVGKNLMEERILEEASYLTQAFTENMSTTLEPHELLESAVTNILSTIIFGKRFEYDSNFLKCLLDLTHQNFRLLAGPWALLSNAVPLVRNLPLPHQKILTNAHKMFALFEKEMEEHKATLTLGEPRDFIDAYLEEIQKKPERKSSSFEEEQLRVLLFDLINAGTETTSATLQWAFLYLVAFPEIQEKCWKEIDKVLGNKDTMVLVNIQSAHRDESQWKFPNEFNPSNFLNEEGEFVKPEAFLPFSAGPRFCLGEILARMELFLLFISIVRNFQLSWPDKSQAPDLTPHFAITQSPSRFKVLLKCRQPSG
ncbi:cytochrome P450 2J2-like isoform X5 [Thamnophis elegans]|uniref:cytochrome P450 2J2-like isoform X5 n=1 Tax=Thamnophis elegans TaxID=35005 RepID=UPI0013780C0C|nr:cytochrome P450 2J2-like isoform X5 [Thamnophis elegans]